MVKKQLIRRLSTKRSDTLLANSNFHQLRAHQKQEAKIQAKEELKRKLKMQKTMEQDSLLDTLGEQARDDGTSLDASSPLLHNIEEDDEDEHIKHDVTDFIRKAPDGKTIELISPGQSGVMKIKNPRIPVASNPLRFEELKHIEDTIIGMQTMPDFGYGEDNFVIERS